MTAPADAVLVVEDETLIRLLIVAELSDAGFIVFQAANSAAAIAVIEANPRIRLIFTDIDMPGSMDGLDLAAAVHDRWPQLSIIVTSGHTQISAADMPCGETFFAKPYDAGAVAVAIRERIAPAPSGP
jgi:DNA-binding NtrC family response regulator